VLMRGLANERRRDIMEVGVCDCNGDFVSNS